MRALIIGGGGLKGSYDAGVLTALLKKLGNKYFDAIYMSSVGSFTGTFYAANQIETIENTWRNYVYGDQLINCLNPLKGKKLLNNEYLIDMFRDGKSKLDIKTVFSSGVKLNYVIENLETCKAEYVEPNSNNIFELMLAACAVPIIYGPVKVGDNIYIDGGLFNPLPIQKALDDGYKEIVVIYNRTKEYHNGVLEKSVIWLMSLFFSSHMRKKIIEAENARKLANKKLKSENVVLISPSTPITTTNFNRRKSVININFDLGLKDGYAAISKILKLTTWLLVYLYY